MAEKIRDAADRAIENFGEIGRSILAAILIGGAGVIVVRALIAP
jgi:hypothetical protein